MAPHLHFRVQGSRRCHYFVFQGHTMGQCHRSYISHQKVKICHNNNQRLYTYRKSVCAISLVSKVSWNVWFKWPCDNAIFVIYVSKPNKNRLFSPILSWFDLSVTLRWPCYDLWGNTPVKPNPNRCHHVYFITCIRSAGNWSKSDYRWIIWSISAIWERGDIRVIWWGIIPLALILTLLLIGVFCYIPMLGSRWVATTIDISIELNWSKTNKNRLFSPIWSW